jgi:hypothetical protein
MGCSSGLLNVYTSSSCSGLPTNTLEFTSGSVYWQPSEQRTYYLRVFCSGGSSSSCIPVTVGGGSTTTSTSSTTTTTWGTTTTTLPLEDQEFEFTDMNCNKYECSITISENTINENVLILIWLKDSAGKIYYDTIIELEPGDVGQIREDLFQRNFCPNNKNLDLLALFYRQSNLNQRMKRYKEENILTC